MLDGVTVFGFGLGKAGSAVAKVGSSLVIDCASWILDELTETQDRWEILVTHSTVCENGVPKSWVTWTTKDVSSGKTAELKPKAIDNTQNQLAKEDLERRMKVAYGDTVGSSPTPLVLLGESRIPASPSKMLRNVAQGSPQPAVIWPNSPQTEGGHIFIQLEGESATYAIALRTEVRANYWTKNP